MEYRVEQLAGACDVSVDTVRYYQSKGLLPAPRRHGRVALYGPEHVRRLRKIRSLQRKGLTLAVIRRALDGSLARVDMDLARAVAAEQDDGTEVLTLDQLAARSGVPAPLLKSVERAGIPLGRMVDGATRYSAADADVVRQAVRILDAGLPLAELLRLASDYNAAASFIAERAVALFDEHVRTPVRASGVGDEEAAARIVAAFRELLPAVTAVVAHHFRRVLLATAEQHIEAASEDDSANRVESRRLREVAWVE